MKDITTIIANIRATITLSILDELKQAIPDKNKLKVLKSRESFVNLVEKELEDISEIGIVNTLRGGMSLVRGEQAKSIAKALHDDMDEILNKLLGG